MATILALPAHPRDCNTVRAAIAERARTLAAGDTQRNRAVRVALGQLREGSSTAWAITQGHRALRGSPRHTAGTLPRGAA